MPSLAQIHGMSGFEDDPIELLTPAEMARADSLTIAAGAPGYALMLRAGKNVANAAADMLRGKEGGAVAVFCGPGNNGGDGYVAARLLREQGFVVVVASLGDPRFLRGEAAQAFADWGGQAHAAQDLDPAAADLVIDALFGAGLTRPLDGFALQIVEKINASGKPVLAVDVPSGMDGANGAVGSGCIKAQETVTFFRLKPGHLLLPGRLACGEVRLTQIGIGEQTLGEIAPRAFLNAPALWLGAMPWPRLRRPQIFSRTSARCFRADDADRRGASRRACGIARRRRACHACQPNGIARRQRRRAHRDHVAPGR